MKTLALALGALSVLAGCASSPTLPYAPAQQPAGAKISAAYQIAGDTLRFEVDTDHRRLEEARILKADGTEVRAVNIENPPIVTSAPSSSFGFGIGGVSGGGGSGVGVGTGLSVGGPVGSPTTTIEGHTFISFPLSQSGPAPWSLQLRLAGTETVVILVGGR
jgi:hypothetical protein